MPELPDIEYYKKYFNSKALHKKIKTVDVKNARVLKGVSGKKLDKDLEGKSFIQTKRRGKYLFAQYGRKKWICLHFGMTGNVKYFKSTQEKPRHARVLFSFTNGYSLAFLNQRLLGQVSITKSPEEFIENKELGPDALSVSYTDFRNILTKKSGSIKSALMDQKDMAGIGNIYADEILFQSRVYPKKTPEKLEEKVVKRIYRNMRKVLKKASEKKADPDKFSRSWLIPVREKGGKCPVCGKKLKRIKVSGRTAYFCPGCQK
jgi:formamidopyrimidine-DNA glycosylase